MGDSMSTLVVTNLQSKTVRQPPVMLDSGGIETAQFVRAWVNFQGTGVVAIRDAFNVSSISDLGVGVYNANFTNALGMNDVIVGGANSAQLAAQMTSTTVLGFNTALQTGTALTDANFVYVAVIGR